MYSFEEVTKMIWNEFRNVFWGEGVFYNKMYFITFVTALISLVHINLEKKKDLRIMVWIMLCFIFFNLTSFLISIVSGAILRPWSQIIIPFVLAGNLTITIEGVKSKKMVRAFVIACSLIMVMNQSQMVLSLLYTDDYRYMQDYSIAESIYDSINQVCEGDLKAVVILGTYEFQTINSITDGDVIGASQFAWDLTGDNIVTNRAYMFMESIGKKIEFPTDEQISEAILVAENMPVWPNSDSVVDCGEFVVVKLSEIN